MNRKWYWFLLPFCAIFMAANDDGCSSAPKSDMQQQSRQEQMSVEANAQVGMPGITNFTEKKLVRKIYELRDQEISTFSYIQDMQGRLWHLCDSIGYGLPYAVQFSNPEKIVQNYTSSYGTLPQSEPNGLFMPPSADGTWVMCASPKGYPTPVYVEPRVIVSPFRLNAAGDYQK
jgi:hypothetical protein